MVQGVKLLKNTDTLTDWFKERADEFIDAEKKNILRLARYSLEKRANDIERKVFKYIAKYMLDHLQPARSIEGMPTDFERWINLSKSWITRKGHGRKYFNTGSLINYLSAKDDATWYYGRGKAKVDYNNDSIIYESMFNHPRKPFTAIAQKRKKDVVYQEDKFTYNEYDKDDNPVRPVFEPMENFLFEKKLNNEIDKWIEEYMEKNYD